jgi:tetratricopeptide (TPR) repeat protein
MAEFVTSHAGSGRVQQEEMESGSRCNAHCRFFILLFLACSILMVYWRVQNFNFVYYDDQVYVTENTHVQSGLTGKGIVWAFSSLDAGFWHPLTWLSLMLDFELFGLNPGGYHITNVLFHIASTLLLFLALNQMTGAQWRSAFVAAMFALHPLHVESVAWISERKDVLSAFFWMLTMWSYNLYTKHPSKARYLWVAVAYFMGLMAKPILVTLPFVLLLLDYWPLNRFSIHQSDPQPSLPGDGKKEGTKREGVSRLILEKIPLLLLAALASTLAFLTEQRAEALSSITSYPVSYRITNALVSYWIYAAKAVWPHNLAAFYPHPGLWPIPDIFLATLFLLTVIIIALYWRKRFPYIAVGWFWFLGTLVPVIGIIQIGSQAMADRHSYIPLIGFFLAVTWAAGDFFRKRNDAKLLPAISALAAIIIFSACSWIQVSYWKSTFALFQHAVEVTKDNYKALHGLGWAYHSQGDDAKAIALIRESIRLKSDARAHNDLGVIYMGRKEFREAEREFTASLKLKPHNPQYLNNIGAALASQGKTEEAIPYFREAIHIQPDYKGARDNLLKALQPSRPLPN